MRLLVPLLSLAACGPPKSPPPPERLAVIAPPPSFVFDALITRNVVAILESRPALFPALQLADKLLGAAPCWHDLERAVTAAYQLQVPKVDGRGNTSYFVIEGDLPRDRVAACLPTAGQAIPLTTETDGDLLAVHGPDGSTAFAAWRGPFVVIGDRALVEQALTAPAAAREPWHAMLQSTPPTAPLWWGSTDNLLANLLGVHTVAYEVVLERLETAPNPYFAGRVYATFATAADAAIAARRAKQGELQLPFDAPELADSFKRMTVKQIGPKVEIGFDLAMFGGITADTLATWASQLPH